MTGQIRCHYEVLDVPRDADAAAIKKSHRRKALVHHPDKTVGKSEEEQHNSAAEFKLIQAAYECLSDTVERKWYDEHRDMILRGGMGMDGTGGADGGDGSSFLFDVMPFQFAGCYDGYDNDDPESFYSVYNGVFEQIFEGEQNGYISEGKIDTEKMINIHLSEVQLGDSTSNWEDILAFYNTWEGFTSGLSFAWVDTYHLNDIREAPNRRIRRLMEDDNKKKRKAAKRERLDDIGALVRFVKKRDPRVKAQREKSLREQAQKEAKTKRDAAQRKKDVAAAKEEWRAEAEREMAEQEAADLNAGRFRLADLDSDDDYDYGGGRKKKGKRKGKGKGGKKNPIQNEDTEKCEPAVIDDEVVVQDADQDSDQDATMKDENDHNDGGDENKVETSEVPPVDDNVEDDEINADADVDTDADVDDDLCIGLDDLDVMSESSSSEESEEPDSWRCLCCRKDFKSQKQFENHERSKKHKEMFKKYQKKLEMEAKEAEKEALKDMMDEIDDEE